MFVINYMTFIVNVLIGFASFGDCTTISHITIEKHSDLLGGTNT